MAPRPEGSPKQASWKGKLYQVTRRFGFLRRLLPAGLKRRVFARLYGSAPERLPYAPGAYPAGVNLYGFLTAALGLGQGARLYARALEAAGIPTALLDARDLIGRPVEEGALGGGICQAPRYDVSVIHINPDMLPLLFHLRDRREWDRRYLVGVWLWELPRIPEDWKPFLSIFDEFWAPSRFIAEAVGRETEKPVVLMPYGLDRPRTAARFDRAHFGLPEGAFLVLCMFDTSSYAARKNPGGAVQAFEAAFADAGEEALLVVKVHGAGEEDLQKIRALVRDPERLVLLNHRMEREESSSLIACCDVLVSLHRSEGFGLILLEAMALGVPVVATDWSANTDFMDGDSACMVQYTLVSTKGAYLGGQQDQLWAEPDTGQAARYLRALYEDPDLRRRIGAAGQRRAQAEYSIQESAKRLKRRFEEIHQKTIEDVGGDQ